MPRPEGCPKSFQNKLHFAAACIYMYKCRPNCRFVIRHLGQPPGGGGALYILVEVCPAHKTGVLGTGIIPARGRGIGHGYSLKKGQGP